MRLDQFELFDSHFHIIDERYPLVANDGFVPSSFTLSDYLTTMSRYNLCGGAIVSGSFQAFHQNYLTDALKQLGPSFVGVTQLPWSVSNEQILELDTCGVRAIRFNLKRGGSESLGYLSSMASRISEIACWHVELYVESADLPNLYNLLIRLPSVSIDHLGLGGEQFKTLVKLAEKGIRVKATGFGRVNISAANAIKDLYSANPESLMFGTDLPSTRAPRAYSDSDFELVIDTLGHEAARNVFSRNALKFYRLMDR